MYDNFSVLRTSSQDSEAFVTSTVTIFGKKRLSVFITKFSVFMMETENNSFRKKPMGKMSGL